MRGTSIASNEAIHNTESTRIDCHDFANAKSRNDEGIEAQDSRRQDFGDKNGALRAEAREHTQVYVTEAEVKQSPFLAQKPTPQEITHTLIIGDNYPALLNLLIRYKSKIKVIYIDPPYGKDDMGQFAETNYHNAITRDNLLSMLYPRLQLARELLKDDGVIFCSIDDRNQAYVKCLFDEVFGEGNFVNNIFVLDNLKGKANDNFISNVGHYVLAYSKNRSILSDSGGFNELENIFGDKVDNKFKNEDSLGFYTLNTFCKTGQGRFREDRPFMYYPILLKNKILELVEECEFVEIYNKITKEFDDNFVEQLKEKYEKLGFEFLLPLSQKGEKLRWTSSYNTARLLIKSGELVWDSTSVKQKKRPSASEMLQVYASGVPKSFLYKPQYANGTDELYNIFNKDIFAFPKSTFLIKDLLKIATTTPEVEEDSESENVGAMDCHDFANAKSRNDKEAVDCHALQSKARNDEGVDSESESASPALQSAESQNDTLLKTESQETEIILDFFAGSGTTAHAVMELNREDGGKRQCILVTNNEKTELNPQGIAIDVTSKRLKRIMSGECYDGSRDFKWIEKNEPYGGRLEVYEVQEVADTDQNVFEKIDEGCYGLRFDSSPKGVQDKIEWVCRNFELTCKSLESNDTDSTNKGE